MTPADPGTWAAQYAAGLLADLGVARPLLYENEQHPAVAWCRSGLADLTGFASGNGLMGPAALAAAADGALLAFNALTGSTMAYACRGSALLGERAGYLGLKRAGATAPGGSCRLLPARDGFIAVNLARPEDHAVLPAWLESNNPDWRGEIGKRYSFELIARGCLLGLPVAGLDECPSAWCTEHADGARSALPSRPPVVLDFSSLWAGPLAGALLAAAGAHVTKVESTSRPDGARAGNAAFFDRLNGSKARVALDFSLSEGRDEVRRLIAGADIVVESARPRAWQQLGIEPEEMVAARPGLSWISITGHGRLGEAANRVGFGDDCAIAGGVGREMVQAYGQAIFAGDAIADPLTGLHAACAAWAAWLRGGGIVAGLALSGVVARCLAPGEGWQSHLAEWTRIGRVMNQKTFDS